MKWEWSGHKRLQSKFAFRYHPFILTSALLSQKTIENRMTTHRKSRLRNYVRFAVLLLIVGILAVWHWTPLRDWLTTERLLAFGQDLQQMHASPLIVLPGLIVASLLMVPFFLIVILSELLFGPWWGFFYALMAGVISGLLGYYMGAFLGRDIVQRFAGKRLHKISTAMGKRGILAAIALRVLPFAPFTVQNMVAGASHIKQWDFNIGNAIGLVPGIAFILLMMSQLSGSLKSPNIVSIVGLILSIAVFILLLFGLRHWLSKRVRGVD